LVLGTGGGNVLSFLGKKCGMFSNMFWYFLRYSPLVLLGLIPDPAQAHLVNTDVGVFYAGMMHPLTSAEHLLPTLALGLLASQSGKQAARGVVFMFPVTLVVGILIGYCYPQFDFVRTINLSLLAVLGGLLMVAGGAPPVVAAVLAIGTGLILGYRSGVDMAASLVGAQFIPGVALTGLIVMVLFSAWVPQVSSTSGRVTRGLLGAVLTITGIVLLFFPVTGPDLQTIRSVGLLGPEDIIGRIKRAELSAPVVFAALTGSLVWGAGHALTPGHGKAVVAAYLVGAHSTWRHAVYLGLTVAASHTLVVFALGLITLLASRFILTDRLYPWIGLSSGLIVTCTGAAMAASRLRRLKQRDLPDRHHSHGNSRVHRHDQGHTENDLHAGHDHRHGHAGHEHSHVSHHNYDHCRTDNEHYHFLHNHGNDHPHIPHGADGTPVTWKALLGIGISGGLMPCPAALVLLLTAISLGRVGFGMILVTVFSLGLAGILIIVGLLFIKGGRLLAQIPQTSGFNRWLPVGSALVVFGIGVLITIQAAALI
jgi:ABC-type nickel/cobalt efflux system permease component RcnA/hydrogenase/urease accessory protein HupE